MIRIQAFVANVVFCGLSVATAAERKEIRIATADLAPAEMRSDEPAPGKWWLSRDARFPGGMVLLTGKSTGVPPKESVVHQVIPADRFVASRVPLLNVNPGAAGWYRIYVGLFQDDKAKASSKPKEASMARLLGRLSGERFPEYLQVAQNVSGPYAEVYWKAANLTGKTIQIEQPLAPMPHPGYGYLGGLTHLRLVPMTAAEVAAAKREIELPPKDQRLFGLLDTTDEFFWWGTADREEDIRAIVNRHQQAGFGRVYWRCFGTHLDNSLAVPEAAPRWTQADDDKWRQQQKAGAGWLAFTDRLKKFDHLKVASDYGKEIGCDIHAWVRMTNFNRAPYANFWHDHPEFLAQMPVTVPNPQGGERIPIKPFTRTKYSRVLSFAYPEVRAFYVKFIKQIASTGTPGIMLDLLRHPPIAGYEPIVTEAFKKKYGTDMESRDVYHDPLVQEHLSEYLRAFLVELRKAIGPKIEIGIRCSGPNKFALRGKEWIAEGLINTILDAHWYSGSGIRPTIDETVMATGTRGTAMVVAGPGDVDPESGWKDRPGILSPEAIAAFGREYSGRGLAAYGLYESTVFTYYPDSRRAVRAAGWNYDPRKTKPGSK